MFLLMTVVPGLIQLHLLLFPLPPLLHLQLGVVPSVLVMLAVPVQDTLTLELVPVVEEFVANQKKSQEVRLLVIVMRVPLPQNVWVKLKAPLIMSMLMVLIVPLPAIVSVLAHRLVVVFHIQHHHPVIVISL